MRRNVLLAGLATLALGAFLVAARDDGGVGPVEVSEPLPVLTGEAVVGGASLSSDDFAGDVLVINAWATWCVPCRQEQPALIRVFERYRERGVSFLGIDHLDDRATATNWIEVEFDVPYPSLFDPSGQFAAILGYPGLPATFVVDAEGIIRYRQFGPITERMLTDMLDRVLTD
jgi:cytochrome c biogenesis protein CcmG, thiol:disulfide interchange protein DsbE